MAGTRARRDQMKMLRFSVRWTMKEMSTIGRILRWRDMSYWDENAKDNTTRQEKEEKRKTSEKMIGGWN